MKVAPLWKFIQERHAIYLKKERSELKPWTRDPILQNYRFTTCYREFDKVTVWIRENWREPHQHDPYVWFAMCVARYINWPMTLEEIGYPVPWQADRVVKLLNQKHNLKKNFTMARSHKETPHKILRVQTKITPQIFGGAYFLNSIGPKIESIMFDRLTPLWKNRDKITTQLQCADSLSDLYEVFREQHGFGSFMAAQVVADIKYLPMWASMSDWWTWAASGPGSKRGLNRLVGRPINAPWRETEWLAKLTELCEALEPLLAKAGMPPMHAQDVQGIGCCEWDKYCRAKLGEGRPKTKYPRRKIVWRSTRETSTTRLRRR